MSWYNANITESDVNINNKVVSLSLDLFPHYKDCSRKVHSYIWNAVVIMIKRILIAEDDFSSREALTKLATSFGFDVVAVADGAELLSIANAWKFDLIITDLIMPELNGASVFEIMKLGGNNTPMIAVTGLSVHDIRFIKDKFVKIFYKPINAKKLLNTSKSLIQR